MNYCSGIACNFDYKNLTACLVLTSTILMLTLAFTQMFVPTITIINNKNDAVLQYHGYPVSTCLPPITVLTEEYT